MTPEERWREFEGYFIKGTFKDPEIAYGFIMQVRQAYEEGVADGRQAAVEDYRTEINSFG